MSYILSESQIKQLNDFLRAIRIIGLDFNWLISVGALSAQELAVKKKLKEFGINSFEADFQKIVKILENKYNEEGKSLPSILLSVSRSYRYLRAKILHDPFKISVGERDAEAIVLNTIALIESLFTVLDTSDYEKIVKNIKENNIEEALDKFFILNKNIKLQFFQKILDEMISLDYRRIEFCKKLAEFSKRIILEEKDDKTRCELFALLFEVTYHRILNYHTKMYLLKIVSEVTSLQVICNWIKSRNCLNEIITEFSKSNSFDMAGINSKIIYNLASIMNDEEIIKIIDASIENDQIYNSFKARSILEKLLKIYESRIPEDKRKKLIERIKS